MLPPQNFQLNVSGLLVDVCEKKKYNPVHNITNNNNNIKVAQILFYNNNNKNNNNNNNIITSAN